MPLKGQQSIVAVHPVPIVRDADELAAARLYFHADTRCPRIQRIFEQFLHHRRRPVHHLARGDLVGDLVRKNVNAAHGNLHLSRLAAVGNDPLLCKMKKAIRTRTAFSGTRISACQLAAVELDTVEPAQQCYGHHLRLEEVVRHCHHLVFGNGLDAVEDLLHTEEMVEVHLLARQV